MSKTNTKSQGKKGVSTTIIYKSDGKIIKIISPNKRLTSVPKVYIRRVSNTNKVNKTEDYIAPKIAIKDHDYVAKQNWPTLEISPGGIIKPATKHREPEVETYSCGNCPQTFKFLYNLVEHVQDHDIKPENNEFINYYDVTELRDHGYGKGQF